MVVDAIISEDYRFVGRASELKGLIDALGRVKEGKGTLVVVEGEAGIGKTRLLNELGRIASEQGFEVLRGRCLTLQQADPYHPFLDALKGKLGRRGRVDEPKNEGDLPLGLIGVQHESFSATKETGDIPIGLIPIADRGEAELSDIDIQTERDRLFNTILEVVTESSQSRPLMLFIDDLQWADSGTVQLLFHIARNIAGSRILLCTAYRPEEMETGTEGQPFLRMYQQVGRVISPVIIKLERMSQPEISELIRNILGIKDVPEKFLGKLYDECEGNPFFVEEVLRSLMDEGIIHRHGHIWDAGVDISSIRIPSTITDAIHNRIARLNEESKKILRYASVAGDRYGFNVLREVTGMEEEKLLDSLEALIEADIIQEVPDSKEEEFVFVHKLTRGVVYESMSKSRVRLMHKAVGEVTERLYSDNLEPRIYDLARHFTLGKDYPRSHKYSMMAGDKAFRALAFEEAVEYYMTAFRTLDLLPSEEGVDREEERLRLSMTIGNIYYWLNIWQTAAKYHEGALKLAEKNDDKKAITKALVALAHSERSLSKFIEAEKHFEMALELSKDTGDAQNLAEVQRGLGYVHWRRGENDEAVEHYNQSISLSMKAGDLSSMAKTFIELGNVYNHWGDQNKAIEYYNKAVVELEKLQDYTELARAYNNMGDSYLKLEKWDEAIEVLDKCKDTSAKIGNENLVAWSYFNSAEAFAYKDELDEAERRCDKALKICEAQDDRIGMNGVFRVRGIINRRRKNWDEAIENINKSITILEMLDIPYDLANTYFELAKTYEAMGESTAAINNYMLAKDLFDTVGAKVESKDAEKKISLLESKT